MWWESLLALGLRFGVLAKEVHDCDRKVLIFEGVWSYGISARTGEPYHLIPADRPSSSELDMPEYCRNDHPPCGSGVKTFIITQMSMLQPLILAAHTKHSILLILPVKGYVRSEATCLILHCHLRRIVSVWWGCISRVALVHFLQGQAVEIVSQGIASRP